MPTTRDLNAWNAQNERLLYVTRRLIQGGYVEGRDEYDAARKLAARAGHAVEWFGDLEPDELRALVDDVVCYWGDAIRFGTQVEQGRARERMEASRLVAMANVGHDLLRLEKSDAAGHACSGNAKQAARAKSGRDHLGLKGEPSGR